MDEPQELEEADKDLVVPVIGSGTAPPRRRKSAASEKHVAEVEAETAQLDAMDWPTLRALLQEVVAGTRMASTEALIRICRRAYDAGDRAKVNLAFEAATKTATPLLLSQAFGLADDERREQVQEILLQLFAAIRAGKSQLAEKFFAAFVKRRSIDLFRQRESRLEGKLERAEPTGETDPIDALPDRTPLVEAHALLWAAVGKLPPKLRMAFIQYHRFGMTQQEIAEQNKVDVRTVHQWLKEACAALGHKGDVHDR
jgi:RNA polymerase sigma factor (sigma-70 family)